MSLLTEEDLAEDHKFPRDDEGEDQGGDAIPLILGNPDYATLAEILQAAHNRASAGKGRERHAHGKPFLQQPIMEIARMLPSGIDGHAYQIMKKAQEAAHMSRRGQREAAMKELMDITVYASAAVLMLREI
ncbi:hypothetical protein [Nitratireductor rhodophyticola]|uniref:hypothetical protein n=1 Tax=Nitratireductor rhodophyticola TaxID=2854036 RepID=UPI003BA855CE